MRRFLDWLRSVLQGGTPPPVPPRLPSGAPPRAVVEERLAASNVPGAAIAVVEDAEVAWAAGYGTVANRHHAAFVTSDTVFQAASLSKPVTALAVLALAEQGAFGLDADVRPLLKLPLPEHPIMQTQGVAGRAVTPRLLLQHRGGVVGRGTTPDRSGAFLPADRGGGSRRVSNHRGVRVPTLEQSWFGTDGTTPVQLTYPPGSQFSYSGAGYLVLQHLVEASTGRDFADHMAEFLGRLGARSATFDLRPHSKENLALGHDVRGRVLPGGHELVPWSAAGGLFVNAIGMAEIVAAMVGDGRGVVSPASLALMVRQNLGVFGRTESGRRVFRHGGDNGGYRAAITGSPAQRHGVVVLTNGRSSDGVRLRQDLVGMAGR